MCHPERVDDVTWAALALTLTLLGGIWTWTAYRRRGAPAALKGAGLTLLPIAAYLTKTLQMLTEIGDAVVDWATSLVFSPVVWVGVVLAGVAVLLFGAGRVLEQQRGPQPTSRNGSETPQKTPRKTLPAAQQRRGEPAIDDDLAEIEALLRKRGIS